MSTIFSNYLRKLRALVPARTMAIYIAATGLYPMLTQTSTELPKWIPFLAIGLCLLVQILLGIFKDNKRWYIILLSALAFALYGLTQPYIGILGVFEASAVVHLVFSIVVVVFVSVAAIFVPEYNG